MNTNAYIMTDEVINMVINNEPYTVTGAHANYTAIRSELTSEPPINWERILELTDVAQTVVDWAGESGISVVGGVVQYNGRDVHNTVTSRILQGMSEGEDVTPFINFLGNLMQNPSMRAQRELYLFLEQSEMPLTEDGHFLAYKSINKSYKDRHSNKFENSVGSICKMERKDVDDERDNTCSEGLHFCSLSYLRGFWGFGGHTMILKVNPRDVVSIPSDYENAKGRTCRYEVIGELQRKDHFFDEKEQHSVYHADQAFAFGKFGDDHDAPVDW